MHFSAPAEAQLAWLAPRTALPLRERISATLMLGPQPHPYRRIRPGKDSGMQLAVQDWRVDFVVEDQRIEVRQLRTGYRASQLEKAGQDAGDALALHREFSAHFG